MTHVIQILVSLPSLSLFRVLNLLWLKYRSFLVASQLPHPLLCVHPLRDASLRHAPVRDLICRALPCIALVLFVSLLLETIDSSDRSPHRHTKWFRTSDNFQACNWALHVSSDLECFVINTGYLIQEVAKKVH